jgi:hypothetical protein
MELRVLEIELRCQTVDDSRIWLKLRCEWRSSEHEPILSKIGVSGNPGAIQGDHPLKMLTH